MLRAFITLTAALAFAGGSFLTSDFGGFDPNRFPIPQENPPLQPVGFAFAIWFPIYAWLIASATFGLARRAEEPSWQSFRIPLVLSLVVGAPWISVAKVSPIWSTVMIWFMLFTALLALFRAPQQDFMWARAPIGLYAGWLTAASGVGTSVLLAGYAVTSAMTSAVLLLLTVLSLALSIIHKMAVPTLTYGLAIMWALTGIILQSFTFPNPTMVALASLGFGLVAWASWRKGSSPQLTSKSAPATPFIA